MADDITQRNRLLCLTKTPLADDVLLLNQFGAEERIGHLFRFNLDLLSEIARSSAVSAEKLIGKKVTITLAQSDDYAKAPRRYFNGIISRFAQGGRNKRFVQYHAEVVPWMWLLTLTSDCRIFQGMTVPDIVKKVFDDLKKDYPELVSYRPALTGKYTKWDYCVQYRETDFNFVSRLLEREGIYYFFEHEEDKHTLVLADSPQAHKPCPGQPKARYLPEGGTGETKQTVSGWQITQTLRPGKHALRDYHFQMPDKSLEVTRATSVNIGGNGKLEVYDYPGEYAQLFNKPDQRLGDVKPEGDRVVKLRMEEDETPNVIMRGSSSCRAFTPGSCFELTDYPSQGNVSGPYLLTSVHHSAAQSPQYVSDEVARGDAYHNRFICIPQRTPYRPPRVTPKPLVQGPQTAVVVGTKGEEIETDKYGRVKVQFHWDRLGKHDADSSCWVRVAQPWAGKRWGASFWPRIGQEVIIDFLEGDPDRPIITGTVYNADQMPPYLGDGLDPKHANDNKLSGIKSNTTPGGVGFNEWRFDDTKGKEQIFIHAERNMDTRVKNDNMERIINNRHLIVGWEKDGQKGGDQREMIYQDKHLDVKRDHVEKIEGNMQLTVGKGDAQNGGNQDVVIEKNKTELVEAESHLHVKKNSFEKVDESRHLTVDKDRFELIGGNDHHHVKKNRMENVEGMQSLSVGGEQRELIGADAHYHGKGDRNEKIDGNQSLTVGNNQQEKVGQNHALEAGMEIHLKAGMKVIIEAGVQLSLKGPGGFVDIGPAGVTIQGTMVLINSGGSAGSGSGSSPTAPQDPTNPDDATAPADAQEAKPTVPAVADDSKSGVKSVPAAWN